MVDLLKHVRKSIDHSCLRFVFIVVCDVFKWSSHGGLCHVDYLVDVRDIELHEQSPGAPLRSQAAHSHWLRRTPGYAHGDALLQTDTKQLLPHVCHRRHVGCC